MSTSSLANFNRVSELPLKAPYQTRSHFNSPNSIDSNVIENKSILSCVLGFKDEKGSYDTSLVVASLLGSMFFIGGIANLFACVGRGAFSFLLSKDVSRGRKITCGFLVILRTVLSCFGLGFVFFLLDLLYTLGCYIANKL